MLPLSQRPAFSGTDAESHICMNTNEQKKFTSDDGSYRFYFPIRHRRKSTFSKNFTEGQWTPAGRVCVVNIAAAAGHFFSSLHVELMFVTLKMTVMFFTSEELHAEVCYAECLLQRAALTFLQVGTEARLDTINFCSVWSGSFLLFLPASLGWKHDQFYERRNQSEEQLPDIQVSIIKLSLFSRTVKCLWCGKFCIPAQRAVGGRRLQDPDSLVAPPGLMLMQSGRTPSVLPQ